ncbi:acetate kinase AckA [Methyloglobulus morosus KoM1]|uniref:Acetate kinase n=1 Tax=Methyloglobulus morosus KoM1 TaxID=1116472 RepID=V5DZJ8_9GAMM|nr:acetate/propionate family kinase [Methyloglobulus morosus]ESS72721.1 acetate kinase AckA [Methyloglobulus morosus KoM1]
MNKYLLVINAGSSSIKFAVYRWAPSSQLIVDANGQIDGIENQPNFTIKNSYGVVLVERTLSVDEVHDHKSAIAVIRAWLEEYLTDGSLIAVGHRVVHGGQHYSTPVLIDAKIFTDLENLIPLAPLHQPHNLAAIHAFQKILPNLPHVACFDTAFHRSQHEIAQRFALPRHFFDEGVLRYGFHGLSYEYIVSVLPTLDPILASARIIVAHLGSGASLCAIQNGRSIATTMGFSPLDGLVMGTRCGSLDPGVLLYLMAHHGMKPSALEQLLYHESGLLGVSGISSDMRTLLASDNPKAKEAVELFVYRVGLEIGSLTAALGGLDALVFTAGIGEHSAIIRDKICGQAVWLGLELDSSANAAGQTRISTPNSMVTAWVVPTDENRMIASHTLAMLRSLDESQPKGGCC